MCKMFQGFRLSVSVMSLPSHSPYPRPGQAPHIEMTPVISRLVLWSLHFKSYLFFFFKINFLLFIYLIYFWLCRVLVAAYRLFVVVCGLLSSCGVRVFSSLVVVRRLQGTWPLQLWCTGSRAHGLCSWQHTDSSCGAWAQLPRGMWDLSSLTRDRTSVPCIVRQILCHWTTKEVPRVIFLYTVLLMLLILALILPLNWPLILLDLVICHAFFFFNPFKHGPGGNSSESTISLFVVFLEKNGSFHMVHGFQECQSNCTDLGIQAADLCI